MITLLAVAALISPEYLTEVVGDPTPAKGSVAEIAARADQCVAQQLGAGTSGGELIITRDPNAGVIVARNALEYRDGTVRWQLRSRVTIEAREGRFRISHAGIERFNEMSGGWSPVGKWRGSGWQKAEAALQETSASLAACISSPPAQDDW